MHIGARLGLIAGASEPAVLTYRSTTTDTVARTTYTFSGLTFGTAETNRLMVVCITGYDVSTSISSVTIGGISATIHRQNTTSLSCMGIASAVVPTGTTGDVVVTFGDAADDAAIDLYSITNLQSTAIVNNSIDTTEPLDITISADSGSAIIAFANNVNNPTVVTWGGTIGVTKNSDVHLSSIIKHTSASKNDGASGTVTCSYTNPNANRLIVCSWR